MTGLETSRYANSYTFPSDFEYQPRPGDWNCPSCKFSNFANRTACFRCCAGKPAPLISHDRNSRIGQEHPRAGNGVGNGNGLGSGVEAAPAWYQKAHTVLYPLRTEPVQCVTPPETADEVGRTSFVPVDLKEVHPFGGLSTSRWAPRNYKFGTQNEGHSGGQQEVWTRTTHLPSPVHTHTTSTTNTHIHIPDLGLPYEVQHYILTMTQRLLEESCYAFATHWMPLLLQTNNLTCSEAVELSEWRKLLPVHAPPRALRHLPNTTLEKALANAVRIRNKAVHRHLCDNVELKRIAAQAGELMYILGDEGMREKFVDLAEGIGEWDLGGNGGVDEEGRKARLESVLRGVGERDVGGMDWTPNDVSLEEVGAGGLVESEASDEMDID